MESTKHDKQSQHFLYEEFVLNYDIQINIGRL